MAHRFTAIERRKAIETRKANSEQRALKAQQAVVATATTEITSAQADSSPLQIATPKVREALNNALFQRGETGTTVHTVAVFDWWNAPLQAAVEHLNDIKREYDRAAQIVLQRQSRVPQVLRCWTIDHKETAPRSALMQCKRIIPDAGKAAFINNGHKDDPRDPNEKVRTIYCCSMICFQFYQGTRPSSGLSRH